MTKAVRLPKARPHVKTFAFAAKMGLRDRVRALFTGRVGFVVKMRAQRWMPEMNVDYRFRVGNGLAVGHTLVRGACGKDAIAMISELGWKKAPSETPTPDQPSGSPST